MRPGRALERWKRRRRFRQRSAGLVGQRKIVYALTPPPRLKNIGDHAQVVAIDRWLRKHAPGAPILEVDKDETRDCIGNLRRVVGPDDIIVLHSGGNMGDRGLWSENARRLMIQSFPQNKIVSLPQTIHFSDTERGHAERERSQAIYAEHPQLTIIGRDPESGRLAETLFPGARTGCAPDFVLSLAPRPRTDPTDTLVTFCLRRDNESRFTPEERLELPQSIEHPTTLWDTTFDYPIEPGRRSHELEQALDHLARGSAVVTDRFHGLIFTILCRLPCVVLPTVDHKLTSASHWFADVPYVHFAQGAADIAPLLVQASRDEDFTTPDWNARHFDPLAVQVGLVAWAAG